MISPKTNRPIRVGGRAWLDLIRDGVLEGKIKDPKELYEIQEGDDVQEKIDEVNKDLPINAQGVRGRGKYSNKIVKRHKTPSVKDTAQYTAQVASRVVSDPEVYEQLQESDDFERQLENMIMSEMMGGQKPKKRQAVKQPPARVAKPNARYREVAPVEYDEESSDDSGDDSW